MHCVHILCVHKHISCKSFLYAVSHFVSKLALFLVIMALVREASHTRLRVDGTISIRELQSTVAQVLVLAESSDIIGLLRRLKGITWKTHPKPRQVEKLTFLTLEFLKLCPNGEISQPTLRTALLL